MVPFNRIVLVGGTVAAAVGIGFVMQGSGAHPADSATAPMQIAMASPDIAPTAPLGIMASEPVLEQVNNTSIDAAPQLPSVQYAALEDTKTDAPAIAQPTGDCATTMNATPDLMALVELSINACAPNHAVTIHHNGMMISAVTDQSGSATIYVPALSQQAMFIADFGNGEGAVAQTEVPDLAEYDRIVVQWKGDAGFQLHAFENGAGYDDENHIWNGATGEMARAITGNGGTMTTHGDPELEDGFRAEVYTFPKSISAQKAEVSLSVETVVTAANCGRDVAAETLQLHDDGTLSVQELTMAVPDCDGIGNFLVLKNILEDLKIARN